MAGGDFTYIEKRSVRPWILGLCFFWGLVLGFVAYLNSDTYADKQAAAEAKEQEEQAKLDLEKKNKPKKEPEQHVPAFKEVPTATIKSDIEKHIPPVPDAPEIPRLIADTSLKNIPEAPQLAFAYNWGLNGQTTYRPSKPVKLVKPAPRVDFNRTAPAAANGPVDLNSIDGPEFEE